MAFNETTNVPKAIAKAALESVEGHPLQIEAIRWAHCPSDVYSIQKAFIERGRLPQEDKSALRDSLADVENVLVVCYWTSDNKPEPLAGAGKHYAFLLHPESLSVLHADVGMWRS